jgi:hypothetical protein
LTTGDGSGSWPVCFAREEGGFLVLYQEIRGEAGQVPELAIHRVVVSKEGQSGGDKSTNAKNKIAGGYESDDRPIYTAASSGGKVVVASNQLLNAKGGIMISIYDLNGKEEVEGVMVSGMISANTPTIACGPLSCLIAWTKPSISLKMTEKISVVSIFGKVITGEIDAFDVGLLTARRAFLPVADGAMLLWVTDDPKGEPVQMMAKFGWDGKLLVQPRTIGGFGGMDPAGEHADFAAVSPDGKDILIAHPADDPSGDFHHVTAVIIDKQGKETGQPVVIPPDREEDMDAAAFYTSQGAPVVISQVMSSGGPDFDLFAAAIKPK